MIERIAILGGSSVYIPEFILSIIARNVNVKEIVLVGLPGKKLELVSRFCQRLIDKSGFLSKIIATSDVRAAVTNSKYVLNHIRVGGMQARMRDEMLPPKFGMLGHEVLGAGGFSNAMRTLPIIFDLAKQIEETNPNAVFINLTNPMGIVVEAMNACCKLNVLGACDLPGTYARKVALLLQQDLTKLKIDYIGIDHLGWIQDVKLDNRSRMSHVLELLEQSREEGFDHDLIELFRMIPTRNTGMYFHRGEVLKRQKTCDRFRSEVLHEAEKRILKYYEDPHLTEIPDLTRQRNAVWYEETLLPLLDALEGPKEKNLFLCVRNGDSIRDLPENCSVEIPVTVSSKGVKPAKVGSLPRFLKGMYIAAKESDRLTIEAVKHKSYEHALQALTINPFVPSMETAKKYLDTVIREDKLELH
jgi:6-phospho-beta-glucosidase